MPDGLEIGRLIGYVELDDTGVAQGADSVRDRLNTLAGDGKSIGSMVGKGAGLAIAAGLAGAIALEPAQAKLTAQLDLTASESQRIGGVAGSLYSSAYGDSLADVNEALRSVIQNVDGMGDASSDVLEGITGKVLAVSQTFDQDLGGITRAIGTMLRTGLAKDADEALDVLTRGFQNGTNVADDLLDTFAEYSTQFRALGLEAPAAMGLLSQGLKAGARDADTVADALKEFAILGKESTESVAEGYEALGLDAGQMAQRVAAGGDTASGALTTVLDRLRAVADPVERNAIAVGLFGTKAEDLQAALGALDTRTAVDALGNVEGAAQRVADTTGGTAVAQFQAFTRTLQTFATDTLGGSVLPVVTELGSTLLTVVTPPLELLEGIVGGLADGFAALPDPISNTLVVMGALVAFREPIANTFDAVRRGAVDALEWTAYGAANAIDGLGRLGGSADNAGGRLRGMASGGVRALSGALGGPLGLAVTGLTIGVPLLTSLFGDNEDQADKTARANSNLADAIRQSAGAINDNVRAAAAKEAQDKGLLDAARDAGIELELVTEALLGNTDAYEEVDRKLRAYADSQKELRVTSGGVIEVTSDAGVAANKAAGELENLAKTYPETVAGAKQLAEATGRQAAETEGATPIVDEYGRTIEGAADSAEDLLKALDELNGGTLNLRDAQRAHQEALDRARESLAEHGKALGVTTEAGRANEEALDAVAKSAAEMSNAILENGGSYEEFRSNLEGGRKDLYEQARAFGMTEEGAQHYIDTVLAIPTEAGTRIEQPGIERAQRLAELLGDTVLGIPNDKTIHASAEVEAARDTLWNLGYQVNTLPDGTVHVVARTDTAEEDLRRLTRVREIEARVTIVGPNGQRGYRIPGQGTILERFGGIVETYADGGWHDAARSAGLSPMPAGLAARVPANTWRVVGDRPAGDEFYLPDDDAPRTLALGAEWLRRRGLSAVPLAPMADRVPVATYATGGTFPAPGPTTAPAGDPFAGDGAGGPAALFTGPVYLRDERDARALNEEAEWSRRMRGRRR